MAQGMVVLGRIAGAYGLHGWVKLQAYGDDFAALGEMSQWWLGDESNGANWQPRVLEACKEHGRGWIAKFAGIDERNGALALDGKYIAAPRDRLPKTDEDEYYWADLIGMDVVNLQDERLGKVHHLLSTGAHDVLCVQEAAEGTERLLPFVAQIVKSVDTVGRVIRVEWGCDW